MIILDYTFLVNKDNPLDSSFVPNNLVEYKEYNGSKIDPTYKTLVDSNVLSAFYEMQWHAFNEGKKLGATNGFYIIIDSAYRSYDYQVKILQHNIKQMGQDAYKYVALPGTSEHQSGLAIDVALYTNGKYNDDFDDTYPEIQWLFANAHRFGFILRYPRGYEHETGFAYECWHFRYVSPEVSTYMYENNIKTLEEYHRLKIQNGL